MLTLADRCRKTGNLPGVDAEQGDGPCICRPCALFAWDQAWMLRVDYGKAADEARDAKKENARLRELLRQVTPPPSKHVYQGEGGSVSHYILCVRREYFEAARAALEEPDE